MPAENRPVRTLPARMEDRLIVALDLPSVEVARGIVARLDGIATFYKLGLWLIFAPGFEAFLDDLLNSGCNVFPVLWRKGSSHDPGARPRAAR
jgi:orotidine-5'-phosphate decarboxylase